MSVLRGMHARTHLTLLSFISFSVFVYYHEYKQINSPQESLSQNKNRHADLHDITVKTVIAYSFEKIIESHGKEVKCLEPVKLPEKSKFEGNFGWKHVPESSVFVYSAYPDNRLDPHNYVRLIVMIKGSYDSPLYCQLEFSEGVIRSVHANLNHIWLSEWNKGDNSTFEPVLVSCKLPIDKKLANLRGLALAAKPCTNSSARIYLTQDVNTTSTTNYDTSFRITVCVKPLDFLEDISTKLIAWIELNKLLGASQIEIYVTKVHANTRAVLHWYSRRNDAVQVRVRKYSTVTGLPPSGVWQKRREELISYNDCFYRNLDTSGFVLPVDIDEIVVPRHVYTWSQLLSRLFTSEPAIINDYASFLVRNAYYMDQFTDKSHDRSPHSVPVLRNMMRSELSPHGESGKSFVSTKNSLTIFNHYTLTPLKPYLQRAYFVPSDLAQMNHYKNSCSVYLLPECAKYLSSPIRIFDPIISRYKKQLVKNIFTVINLINS